MDCDEFEANFAKLNEHLAEVRPIFEGFCEHYGFEFANRLSIGRYPRIRISRAKRTTIWFDLMMGLDDSGRRFEGFWRGAPYDFGGGACFTLSDGSKRGAHFQKGLPSFEAKPFDEVKAVLSSELERLLPILETWDERYLMEHGARVTRSV